MGNLKDVIYLSNEDYETLVSTGTVTIDGETLIYDENNIYITPDESGGNGGLKNYIILDSASTDMLNSIYMGEEGTESSSFSVENFGELVFPVYLFGSNGEFFGVFFKNIGVDPSDYYLKCEIEYPSSYMGNGTVFLESHVEDAAVSNGKVTLPGTVSWYVNP